MAETAQASSAQAALTATTQPIAAGRIRRSRHTVCREKRSPTSRPIMVNSSDRMIPSGAKPWASPVAETTADTSMAPIIAELGSRSRGPISTPSRATSPSTTRPPNWPGPVTRCQALPSRAGAPPAAAGSTRPSSSGVLATTKPSRRYCMNATWRPSASRSPAEATAAADPPAIMPRVAVARSTPPNRTMAHAAPWQTTSVSSVTTTSGTIEAATWPSAVTSR